MAPFPLVLSLINFLIFFTIARFATADVVPAVFPSAVPSAAGDEACPRDAVKLGICVNVLNLVKLEVGSPPVQPCCSLVLGLVDLEVAVCLCTAIKASVLGAVIPNLPVNLSLLLNSCSVTAPHDFQCA